MPHDLDPTRSPTLVDVARARAELQGAERAFTFLADGSGEEQPVTFRELDGSARAIAAALAGAVRPGERALLLYPAGLEYVAAFLGCLYAGVVAVPAYPPDPGRLARTLPRLRAIAADAQAAVVLTTSPILDLAQSLFELAPELGRLRWTATDRADAAAAEQWRRPAIDGRSLAFLQYTSGSTGAPRGVVLSHAHLMANERAIAERFGHTPADRVVGWLPLYHDMGLIGDVLQPLYLGLHCVLMSPIAFLQRPARWLEAISRYQATTSGGPNFAYDLCVRKVPPAERAALDLSSWRVAFNGAEPVRAETLDRFAEAFAGCGFRREAFFPCYGLAEATLLVTGGPPGRPIALRALDREGLSRNLARAPADAGRARVLVGCGAPPAGHEVLIVDPESRRALRPGEIGEIWVRGPSVAGGYWARDELSRATFAAQAEGQGEGPYLRTGDLGFLDEGGELFVTGRRKDLLIVRGRNLYPQDIERTMEASHAALRPGASAAFTIEAGGEEQIAATLEIDPARAADPGAILDAIRAAVLEEHEVQLAAVALLRPGSIPKTSSGKIQRHACRAELLAGRLDALARWDAAEDAAAAATAGEAAGAPASAPADPLAAIVAPRLGLSPGQIDPRRSLAVYGLDSLAAVEVQAAIEAALDVPLELSELLRGPSLAELGAALSARPRRSATAAAAPADAQPGDHPASHGQRALWFLQRLAPESAAYNLARAIRLRGGLDRGALRRSLEALVDRHPALRTTFPARDGAPVQRVHAAGEAALREVDARGLGEEALAAWLAAEARRPFDLERGPLLRVALLQLSDTEHVLAAAIHHIIADLTSAEILVRELGALYRALAAGEAPALPRLSGSPAAHARREAEALALPEAEPRWAAWLRGFEGAPPALELPVDRPRPAAPRFRGGEVSLRIDRATTAALRALAEGHGTTLLSVLLAAYEALLYRYTGQTDFVVGVPASGRTRADLAGVVGYFVNPLPVRADVSGSPSFTALLERTRAAALEAVAHQDLPFPLLVDRLHAARDPGRNPLFQVMLGVHQTRDPGLAGLTLGCAGARLELGGLEAETMAAPAGSAQLDLRLSAAVLDGELALVLEYDSDVFEEASVTRLGACFAALLAGIAEDPRRSVDTLPLLTREELRALAGPVGAGAPDEGPWLPALIAAQARRTPSAIAVELGGEALTYAELHRRACQVANHLRGMGVGPEALVAICLERSPDLLVALLGVLTAGAAYVPIDPGYPADRVAFMVADARAAALITDARLRERVAPGPARVLCLDADAAWRAAPDSDPEVQLRGDGLIYAIYTSGSTGTPKGAMNTHAGVRNRLTWMLAAYAFGPDDVVLQKTPVSFDVSVWELFLPLLCGARLTLARPGGHLDPAYLGRLIRERGVTAAHFVPSMLQAFLDQPDLGSFPSLRRVFCSGEALPPALRDRFFARMDAELHNLYGPTEAAVDVTAWTCARGDGPVVPIGRPITGARAYVLSGALEPAPIGVIGGIYLGGVQVGRGYLRRPALTAERFVPDPLAPEPGARMYRTGDLGRLLPGGAIAFLGRNDAQVKIRGFRIELGEIEAALGRHPELREAAVLARDDGAGGRRLVAYVVPASAPAPAPELLRSFLSERLPDYMIPALFVPMEGLPRSPAGKLDRRALPAPGPARPALEEGFAPPRTPAERALAALWAEALRLDQVGVHDDFFALGGDSILSMQIVARAARAGLRLTPRQFFAHPTVAGLAAVASPIAGADDGDVAGPASGPVPLSPIQRWFFELDPAEPHHWNQAVVLALRGLADREALAAAIERAVERHDALRLRFRRGPSGWEQAYAEDLGPGWLSREDLSAVPAADLAAALTSRAAALQTSLDLERGPLFRAAIIDLGEGRPGRLVMVAHHLVIDAVSWRVLLDEIEHEHAAATRGAPAQPAQRSMSYRRWVERLTELASSRELAAEAAAFLARPPAGPSVCARIPADAAPPPDVEGSAGMATLTLPEEQSRALLGEAPRRSGARVDELLLTALALALRGWTGARAHLIAMEGHGRDLVPDADLSRAVGWFTALFPLWLELPEGDDALASLSAIQASLRRLPRGGSSYGALRYLSPDAEARAALASAPWPEICFNYLGQLDAGLGGTLLELSDEDPGPPRSPRAARPFALEVNAGVRGGRLRVSWSFGAQLRRESIEALAPAFQRALEALLERLAEGAPRPVSAADFPDAGLTDDALQQVLRQVALADEDDG